MANTYVKISSGSVGAGGASSFTFSSIPQTYTDLLIKASIRTERAAVPDGLKLSYNGSPTGTNYYTRYIEGNGSSVGAGLGVNGGSALEGWDINATNSTSSTFSSIDIYIPNYGTSNYKSMSTDNAMEGNATTGYQILMAGLWSSSTAITSIYLVSATSSNFSQYTTFTLYGIKNS